mgnify:CR=1 FL=1
MRSVQMTILLWVVIALAGVTFGAGCEGTEAKKAITDTVREVVGGELMQKGEEVKKQIDDVYEQVNEKIRKEFGQQFPGSEGAPRRKELD